MSIPSSLVILTGDWEGDNTLWLMPGEPPHHSETTASVIV